MLKSGQLSHQLHAVETDDRGIQDIIEIITAASASLIIQATSDMSQYLLVASKSSEGKIDIMPPLTKMKDTPLSLAGKANQ